MFVTVMITEISEMIVVMIMMMMVMMMMMMMILLDLNCFTALVGW